MYGICIQLLYNTAASFFHHFWILVPLPETSNRKQAIATATNRKIVIRMSAELPEFAKNS